MDTKERKLYRLGEVNTIREVNKFPVPRTYVTRIHV
jgi:hypothetical protein